MMLIDISPELVFKTSRSGGAGGQNVNKVETAVEASWNLAQSAFFTELQKQTLTEKLANRMTKDGLVIVRSQVHRTQLANKEEVIEKFNDLVKKALEKKKLRIATRPSKMAKAKRLDAKKIHGEKKQNRNRSSWD